MARRHLEAFSPPAAGQVTSLQSDVIFPNTLEAIIIKLTNITKAQCTRIQIKLGTSSKPIWDITGAQLDSINKYEGRPSTNNVLVLPFSNNRARTVESQFQGALDLGALGIRRLVLEITLDAAVANPAIEAWAEIAPPKIITGPARNLFRALLSNPLSFAGAQTRFPQQLSVGQAGGGLLRRIHHFSAIVTSFALTRDSVPYFDDVPADVNAAYLDELGHDPQTNVYTFDAIDDDNESKSLTSVRVDKGGASLIPQQYLYTTSGAGNVPTITDIHTTINGL